MCRVIPPGAPSSPPMLFIPLHHSGAHKSSISARRQIPILLILRDSHPQFGLLRDKNHLAFFVHTDGAFGPIRDQARELLTSPEHIYE